jgi:hypothetical protein
MASRIETLLNAIAATCTKPALSRKDWDNLSSLAVQMYRAGGTQDTEALAQFFISRGCSIHRARFFGRQLESFWTVLRLYDEENANGDRS